VEAEGVHHPVCELDVRVGGAWHIVMRAPNGTAYPCGGVYREVVEPERLVFTNIATDKEGKLILDGAHNRHLRRARGRQDDTHAWETRAVAVIAYAAAYLGGMEQGWTQSLERLAEFAAKPWSTSAIRENTSRSRGAVGGFDLYESANVMAQPI